MIVAELKGGRALSAQLCIRSGRLCSFEGKRKESIVIYMGGKYSRGINSAAGAESLWEGSESMAGKIEIRLFRKKGADRGNCLIILRADSPRKESARKVIVLSEFRFDQTKGTILPAVYHIDFVSLSIAEYEKVMSEKIHLYAGILGIHRLDAKALRTDDLYLILIRNQVVGFKKSLLEIAALLMSCNQFVFIFAKLPLDDLLNKVNRNIHIAAYLFRTDDVALHRDGHLDLLALFLHT